ncbi:MAG TPA: acyltransferase [Candidatus Gastranaerophilales bacterium]|nr:acyltransferase [Candidatus Gastranaerophilales bacterium]
MHKTERFFIFDILKVIGLFCIIFAHVQPPYLLLQLRNFDVPLMVIISGVLFYYTTAGKTINYLDYLKKRVMRLIYPVWIFLIFYFGSVFLLNYLSGHSFPYSSKTIIESFLFFEGIGYVWIIRVFILVALISPLFLKIYESIEDKRKYLLYLLIAYLFYEILYAVNLRLNFNYIFENIVMYIIPYGIFTAFGFHLTKMKNKSILIFAGINLIIFTIIALILHFKLGYTIPTWHFKYPPGIYFFSYALFCSLSLYLILKNLNINKIKDNFPQICAIITFISASSLWIYLWHIFYIYLWNTYFDLNNFLLQFFVILILSLSTTIIQKQFIQKIIGTEKNNFNNFMSILFLK